MSDGMPGIARGPGAVGALAELTGLHGAFVFPERLLQQIWLRGDFDARALRLRDGRPLKLVRRGRWNRLGGPDFRDAEMRVGEGALAETWRGDVEVHLRATDWDQHGHASDPAYARVVLHVVLFPAPREWTRGVAGARIPILELLPLLERDLEAYAEEAAVEALAGRPYSRLRAALMNTPSEILSREVERHAVRRWAHKVSLARRRIGTAGWEEACHRGALEVLGYRPNRAPMLALAERWPLEAWKSGRISADEAWKEEEPNWHRGGVRPANQPRARLAQYCEWVRARPDWPARLARLGTELGSLASMGGAEKGAGAGGLRARRRMGRLGMWRKRLAEEVAAGAVGGTRFETIVCDSWLPLLAARAEVEGADGVVAGLERWWRDWTPGDAPAELLRLAREFEVGGLQAGEPLSQGDLQGLLGWLATLVAREGRGT
jgi:Protein of unknown function (DUF2851).